MSDFTRRPTDEPPFLGDLDRGLELDADAADEDARDSSGGAPITFNERSLIKDVDPSADRPLLNLFPMRPAEEPVHTARETDEEPLAELLDIGEKPHRPARRRERERETYESSPQTRSGHLPAYGIFYALWEHPFEAAADPRFLFHSAAYDRAEQQLIAAIDRRDGLVALTGEAGVGKTLLCRAALARIDRRTFTAFVDDTVNSIEQLLKMLLLDFGVISSVDLRGGRLTNATQADLTLALTEFLRSLVPLNARAVVLIDDAHRLPAETLMHVRALAALEGDERLLQVVLVGEPELSAALGRRDGGQGPSRVSARVTFDRLEREEIGGYLTHRLGVASDNQSRLEFDESALSVIDELSTGLPGVVNRLADASLARGFNLSSSLIDGGMVESAARDLHMLAPQTQASRIAKRVAIGLVLLAFVLVGVAAGMFVFRQQVQRAIAGWKAVPPPPADPAVRTVVPYEPAAPNTPAATAAPETAPPPGR